MVVAARCTPPAQPHFDTATRNGGGTLPEPAGGTPAIGSTAVSFAGSRNFPARPCRQLSTAIGLGCLLALLLPSKAGADGSPTVLSFTNANAITINDGFTDATPFPSSIQVPALPGALQSVTATLYGLTDPQTFSIEILLTGPSGQGVALMCDAGNGAASDATITIADGAGLFPSGAITTGTYQPSGTSGNAFPSYSTLYQEDTTNQLAGFIGTTLEGTWSLSEYYADFVGPGSISGGWSLTFTMVEAAPAVTTLAASEVTPTNATLNATVNPDLSATMVYFEYGPTTNYGSFSATNTLASDLVDAQAVALAITGLAPGTTTHFQAVAQNSAGTNFGGDLAFVTSATTSMLVESLTNGSKPVLNLYGNPGSKYIVLVTTNLSPLFTWTVLTNLTLTNGVQSLNPDLAANVMDYFALVTNAPEVTTLAASALTSTNATLNATVNPNGGPATVYFEYGPTTNYGSFSATNTLAPGLADAQAVALGITGLAAGTTNHFQAVAQDSLGTNFGGDLSFVTVAAPPVLVASLTNGVKPVLTLYGSPGSTYAITLATNLSQGGAWILFTNLTLTNAVQAINLWPATNRMEFFRASGP
jgi:spore maturation protein SpmB